MNNYWMLGAGDVSRRPLVESTSSYECNGERPALRLRGDDGMTAFDRLALGMPTGSSESTAADPGSPHTRVARILSVRPAQPRESAVSGGRGSSAGCRWGIVTSTKLC